MKVAVGGSGVAVKVAVGGIGVAVAGSGVGVGGRGVAVAVGGTGVAVKVAVGGRGVAVKVAVGGRGVAVAGSGVAVGGRGVAVEVGVAVGGFTGVAVGTADAAASTTASRLDVVLPLPASAALYCTKRDGGLTASPASGTSAHALQLVPSAPQRACTFTAPPARTVPCHAMLVHA